MATRFGQNAAFFPVPDDNRRILIDATRRQSLEPFKQKKGCVKLRKLNENAILFEFTSPLLSKTRIPTPSVCPPFIIDVVFRLVECQTNICGDFPTWPVATCSLSGCKAKLKAKSANTLSLNILVRMNLLYFI